MTAPDVGTAPPGWYLDPSGATAWRWWDGVQWTAHASPPIPPAGFLPPSTWASGPYGPGRSGPYPAWSPAVASPPSVHDRFASELDAAPQAKHAFFGMLAVTTLIAITAWPQGAWLRSLVDQVGSQVGSGTVKVTVNPPAGLAIASSLILLLEIAVVVVLLNWQFSSARTARMLGMPAARSPGLGVGGWFIPVVNFWLPYQAIRDCLPPGDPARRAVLRMWLSYLGAIVSSTVAVGLSYARTPVAFAVAELAVAFGISVAVNGAAIVQAIADAHRQLLEHARPDEVTSPVV